MERRVFLASLSAAFAAETRIRIGFLGGSHPHAQGKARVVQASSNFELSGIWEPDPKLQEAYRKMGLRLVSREEILGDASIPVVAVESDVKDHASLGKLALQAGKHLHIEKPPADNLKDLEAILELARAKESLVQQGYMWRYHPGINKALEAARNGWLGSVYMVRGTINSQLTAAGRAGINGFRGGELFELGGHLIDPMIRLLGRPSKITPYLKSHGPFQDGLSDNNVAVFEFPSALGVILCSAMQPNGSAHRTFEVLGTNGSAVVHPIEPGVLEIDLTNPAGPYKAGRQTVPLPPYKRYVLDFEDLADAIRTGRALAVTPREELLVQEALLAASGM